MTDRIHIYETRPGAFVVAVNDVWAPGIYDSPETATRAASLSDAALEPLASIYRADGEDRPVTVADLERIEP